MSKINNLSIYLSESFLVVTFRRIRLARKMFCLSFFAVFCDFLTFGQVIDSKRKKVLESTEKLVYNIDILTKKRKNHYEK
jgi:hypothetical protein